MGLIERLKTLDALAWLPASCQHRGRPMRRGAGLWEALKGAASTNSWSASWPVDQLQSCLLRSVTQ